MSGGFFISLILILLLQYALQYVLVLLNFPFLWINIIIDFVLAVVFTLINFRGQEKLKNPAFHRSILIYFAILTVMSILFGNYF